MYLRVYCAAIMLISVLEAFLLETNYSHIGDQYSTNRQFVTVSEFHDVKQVLQHEDNEIRQKVIQIQSDMNQEFKLLTLQLQTELSYLNQRLTVCEQKNDSEKVTLEVNRKYQEIEIKYSKLQLSFENLKRQHKYDLSVIGNKTVHLEKKLEDIKQLKSVNQLLDIRVIQTDVQRLNTETQQLIIKEQARSQDFLALLNQTLKFKTELDQIRQKVAVFACAPNDLTYSRGKIIKFPTIKTQIGITNISEFQMTGKFTCPSDGLYLITVGILSESDPSNIYVYKNDHEVHYFYFANDLTHWNLGTAVVALELQVNDTVDTRFASNVIVDNEGSCITIIKVK
ncbi:unnamed protein product [Mytilus edulis]|uniref:C1q domain-containing protein n=1 Tax=Mytilus edulis TaxID=6550 RepID=A0A8S3USK1_MYTED|nr:unnamed protein product [Mytilus edulis]